MELIRRAKNAYIAVSVVMLVFGLVLILWPQMSMSVLCTALGIVMVIFGIVKLAGYFSKDLFRLAFQFDLALGILTLLLGLVLILHPEHMIAVIPSLLGIFILLDGVFKIQTAADARRFGLERWWGILVMALLSGGFGLLLLLNPLEGASALMILLGITILVDGVQNLLVVLYTVRVSKQRESFD